jgi:ABC-type nitrate/sulfonate/bicarbonate transport system substrate-binding protein
MRTNDKPAGVASALGALDRRDFLRRGVGGMAALGLAGGGGLLAACGNDDQNARSDGKQDFGKFVHQVNWFPIAQFSSSYLAEEAGVYQRLGFSGGLELLFGGPNVAVEPVIQQGRALIGVTATEPFAAAVRQGAKLVAIAAEYQRNPYCIASLPRKPIKTPADLVGKKIGIQAYNETLWAALLKVNNIDPSSVKKVVFQQDPTPLINGELDGFLGWVNDQPVSVEMFNGVKLVVMMMADYGFSLYQLPYIVTEESLKKNRAAVIAGLKAEIIGKQMLLDNPEKGIRLLMQKHPDQKIDAEFSRRTLARDRLLVVTPTTQKRGLMYMTDEDIASTVETLALLGLKVPATAFRHDVLDEIYADGIKIA